MPPSPLKPFHPVVREWFRETLGKPSAPQTQGWPAIATGADTLILAPTGTGKTLTAFLWELNALITEGLQAPLGNAVHILYVSPLKALSNDVQRNLELPLAQLEQRFAKAGLAFPEIRVAVRTGDTPAAARQRMLRKTPHILITTPESLHILLTSVRGRGMFSGLRAVIVDEIHAIAGSKRGAHLALTLERLDRMTKGRPQRIGLSATQRPLDEIARFLGGADVHGTAFRPVTIVDAGSVKSLDVRVVSPVPDLADVGGTVWTSVAPLVLKHIRESRTTLVFVNNRGQAEKIAARVNALAEEEVALPYHGSLSRERRHLLERRLKGGELRALVSTSSLELGIDIGSVDLVLQLQSPKRVSSALQRVGRAGHSLGAVSHGIVVPTFRDDALEALTIVGAMLDGDVEPTRVVFNALDVLAQVIVAAVAVDDDWTSATLYDFVRGAYPYHALTRAAFDEVLEMLSGKYPAHLAAELEPRIMWDRATDALTGMRSSRLVAVMSGGTIPDRGLYTVTLGDRTRLGELDEEFVHETRIGDVFQLGSSTWRVQAIEHDRVIVSPAPGAAARMPFWHGEFMSRSSHLTGRLGTLRRQLATAATLADVKAIAAQYRSDDATATSAVEYVHQQRAVAKFVADDRTVVVEHFRDETGSVRLVVHAPFGGRVTAPWGMALAQRVREALGLGQGGRAHDRDEDFLPTSDARRPTSFEIQTLTTDDGIMLRLPPLGGTPPLEALRALGYEEAERRVLDEVGSSSLFGARFRMNAARALLLPRGNPRRRMPLWLQRLKALDLLQAVREYPSFPILVETYRDVLQDAFDMPALAEVLRGIEAGTITMKFVETELPSPFASSMQFGFVMDWMYADDAPRAEQRAAILSLDRALLDELLGGAGADDATLAVLEEVLARRRGTHPRRRARTADELAILLDRAGDLTVAELRERIAPVDDGRRGEPLDELLASGRAIGIDVPTASGAEQRIILAENYARYASAFGIERLATVATGVGLEPQPAAEHLPAAARARALTPAAAQREIVARFLALSSPAAVEDIRLRYDVAPRWLEERLADWTRTGRLARGTFGGDRATTRWTSRKLLEEARRRELAAMRRQIQPVEMAEFAHFLQRWQHLSPDRHPRGEDDAIEVLRQLYAVARPAEVWERDLLSARGITLDPALIDPLIAGGELSWVGHVTDSARGGESRVMNIRFVRRGSGRAWLAMPADESRLGSQAHGVLTALREEGASFFADLQAATGLTTYALRDALRELVGAGLVTNDSVAAMRAVARWKSVVPGRGREAPDPARWLPADFVSRPVVQRRANLRRLPKWRRPDKPGGDMPWPGRWSLVRVTGLLGPVRDESALAEEIARQWLARYGIVARDWWRRERPPIGWRAIYQELKRLEYRGEVRRGYFVTGLAGAQFALPDAIEALRDTRDLAPEIVVMAASDPANPYALPPAPGAAVDPLTRPRGRGALLVTRAGAVLLAAESRGRRVRVRPDAPPDDVVAAAAAFAAQMTRSIPGRKRRDLTVETIDGVPAGSSPHGDAFFAAGFRRAGMALRFYAPPT